MKQLIITCIFLSAITCKSYLQATHSSQSLTSFRNTTDTATISGNWQLQPVLASDTATGKIPQLNFDLKTNKFSGNTGCNAMTGSFVINQDALSFKENMACTKMACPGYNEQIFLENLLKTNRYEIKDGVLQLMYNTTILSKWVRHEVTKTTKQI